MKAVVHHEYGGPEVLRIEDVARPVPKEHEVLVEVHASSVTRSDCAYRASYPFFSRMFTGLLGPRQPTVGTELSGVVVEVGSAVTEFAAGDEVFGVRSGANAEFVCVREAGALAHKPTRMTHAEAAAVCDGALLARTCLKRADLQPGRSILVYGASGSIGTAGVQLARHLGADVTAVCNTKSVELIRSLGADGVIDYEKDDFTKNGSTYDVIFDAVGKHSFRRCRRSLRSGGMFITTDLGFMWHVPFLALLSRVIGRKRVTLPVGKYKKEDVVFLKELIDAGEYRAVIDRTYSLRDVVEAARYVETGQKTGNVVLIVKGGWAR